MGSLRAAGLGVFLVACGGAPETPASSGPPPVPSPVPPGGPTGVAGVWSGPPVQVSWLPDRSALHIALTAPTGGFELRCDSVTLTGTTAEVVCAMTRPHDEVVTQALQEIAIDVEAARMPAGAKDVALLIATWDRGVQYFRAPDPERVATLPR